MFSKRRQAVFDRRQRRRRVGRAVLGTAPTFSGSAVGFVTAPLGPVSAVSGPAASASTRKLLAWTGLDRVFMTALERAGDRERQRVELAFIRAATAINRRLDEGQERRVDGFFDGSTGTSDAEEIFEGVLRAACEDHEQRKAERLGELYAYLAFERDITAAHASSLLELVRRLTYQQLLFLGFFRIDNNEAPSWKPTGLMNYRSIGVFNEISELSRAGLIGLKDGGGIAEGSQIDPANLRTTGNGGILVEAMRLDQAPRADLARMLEAIDRLGKTVLPAEDGQEYAGFPPEDPPDPEWVTIDRLPAPQFPLSDMVKKAEKEAAGGELKLE